MLKNLTEHAHLFELIFEGHPSEALDYIAKHDTQFSSIQVDYFFYHYSNPLYRKSFFEFWKQIINSNFYMPPLSIKLRSFVEFACLRALHLEDEALIYENLKITRTQKLTLQAFAQSVEKHDFIFSLLSKTELCHLIPSLISLSIHFYNAELVRKLLTFQILLPHLNPVQKHILDDLCTLAPPKAHFMHQQMRRFARGFGHIKHPDILLTLAQIKSRKKYNFHPMAISDQTFEDFFSYMARQTPPYEQKFIVTGEHSFCGELRIDENHMASIYLIDSLGISAESSHFHESFITHMMAHFRTNRVYINQEIRQRVSTGCSIFALDDIQHLYRLRLPEQYKNIWDYLEKTACPDAQALENIDILVHRYPLPTPLLRTMQTRKLLEEVIPERLTKESEYPINKKGKTIRQSAQQFFAKNEEGKLINQRLTYKLHKIRLYNWSFLKNCTPEELTECKKQFTFHEYSEAKAQPKPI
jgi:hypothetical protein